MDIVYAIHARLAGGGIGNTAYQAVLGSLRAGRLKRVLCSSVAIDSIPPEVVHDLGLSGRLIKRIAHMDSSGRLNDLSDRFFDSWASRHLEPCRILHCWNNLGQTLQRGKRMGAVTVVECSMVHPLTLLRVLQQASARWGIPSVDLPSPGRLSRYLAELGTADCITIPSEHCRRTHMDNGIAEKKLRVIPYGVDLDRFKPVTGPADSRPFRVLFAGSFSLLKGAPLLVQGWKKLNWKGADLWIAGPVRREMQRWLSRQHLPSSIHWLGFCDRIADIYRQCDVFVLPSLAEGSALVTYEAMASGLPVVVTASAGSVARPGIDGEVILSGEEAALTDALSRIRADATLRAEMGRNARQRIEEFSWEHYGSRLVGTYDELLQERGQ